MDILKFKKILTRYSEGKANETESALVEAWYKSYPESEEASPGEIDNLHSVMLLKIKTATLKRSIFQYPVFRIAASLIVILSIGLLIRTRNSIPDYRLTSTGTKGTKKILLADGSAVWLNANSILKAPDKFSGDLREVILEEGEAFFEIKKDKKHPFIVHTGPLKVQVLGTSFDIRAYKNLKKITVSVNTGKVGITGSQKTLAMLTPGQQLSYDITKGTIGLMNVDPERTKSWKLGYTYLDHADFRELSLTLKNLYGFSLKPGNKEVEKYRFSLRLMHNLSQDELLLLIGQLHHSHFRKEGNDIILQ
jgi:transmembrane sensor